MGACAMLSILLAMAMVGCENFSPLEDFIAKDHLRSGSFQYPIKIPTKIPTCIDTQANIPESMQTPYNRIVKTNSEVHFELVNHDTVTMAAVIRTLPEELQLPRDLTSEEDENIQFHHMQPGIPRFISSRSPAVEPIFSHMLISPDMLRGSTTLDRLYGRSGIDSFGRQRIVVVEVLHERIISSHFVVRTAMLSTADIRYTVGVTQESGHHQLQPAAVTVMSPEYAKEHAELIRLIGEVAGDVCKRFLRIATCGRLTECYHADDEGLSALDDFSGLHVDHDDDPTRYTVLLGLSHMPVDYWPAQFVLAALREYCVLEPFAVLIFPGVQPHKGLAPTLRNPPASPSSAVSTSAMDTECYIYSRLNVVAYPKRYMTEEAPIRLKVDYDGFQLHYKGLASFGTLRNLHEFFACQDMWLSVRAARHTMNPSVTLPGSSSTTISSTTAKPLKFLSEDRSPYSLAAKWRYSLLVSPNISPAKLALRKSTKWPVN